MYEKVHVRNGTCTKGTCTGIIRETDFMNRCKRNIHTWSFFNGFDKIK